HQLFRAVLNGKEIGGTAPRRVRPRRFFVGFSGSDQALNQDHQDQDGQHELQVPLKPLGLGQLDALSGVGLGKVLVVAPAPLADAEQQEDQRADRQQQVADQEVLGVQNVLAAQEGQAAPDVVAQHTGHAGHQNDDHVDEAGLLAVPAEAVATDDQNVFKHRDDGGKAGKGHEHEEQAAPQPPAGHIDKHLGQGD